MLNCSIYKAIFYYKLYKANICLYKVYKYQKHYVSLHKNITTNCHIYDASIASKTHFNPNKNISNISCLHFLTLFSFLFIRFNSIVRLNHHYNNFLQKTQIIPKHGDQKAMSKLLQIATNRLKL